MLFIGFVREMDAIPNTDPRWDELAAGMLVAGVSEVAMRGEELDSRVVEDAWRRVFRVTDLPLCGMLRDTLALAEDTALDPIEYRDDLAGRLMAYGHHLHSVGQYAAAVDVFTLLGDRSGDDVALRMQALQQRAFALRQLARFDDAALTYEMVRTLALQSRSKKMALAADAGIGRVLFERGNVPAAEAVFISVIGRAKRIGDHEALGLGFIDRAAIAGIRRDPVGVIQYSHQALRSVREPYRRDRVMVNMAYAFREVGRAASAHRVAQYVAEKGVHADQRAFGRLVLYHLSIDARDWLAAESARAILQAASVSPAIEAECYEVAARHAATAGDPERAMDALTSMLSVAEQNRISELVIRADVAMIDVRRGRIPAMYEFRPIERIPKRLQRIIATAENALDLLHAG